MMCLCQKVRGEVPDYFDRGNNFRFSHGNGIIVMVALFYTIRPYSCSFLRHIALQIPNRGFSSTTLSRPTQHGATSSVCCLAGACGSLTNLKENTASDDLTIALVIDYRMAEREPEDLHDSQTRLFDLRQARWIAAYAAVMSYEVGHTGWEVEGP